MIMEGDADSVNAFTMVEQSGDYTVTTFTNHQSITTTIPEAWHAALDAAP